MPHLSGRGLRNCWALAQLFFTCLRGSTVIAFAAPNPIRTVLVTGGAGYIGSHTCLELLDAEPDTTRVVVVDTLDNSSEESLNRVRALTNCAKGRLQFRNVDIRDTKGLIKGVKLDAREDTLKYRQTLLSFLNNFVVLYYANSPGRIRRYRLMHTFCWPKGSGRVSSQAIGIL